MLFRTLVLLTARVTLLMKGVTPACVAGYSYRGVIGLTGVGEMGEDYEYGPEDD